MIGIKYDGYLLIVIFVLEVWLECIYWYFIVLIYFNLNIIMVDEDVVVLVVDNGFGMCKVGFVGDDVFWVVFFLIVGCFCY